MIFFELLEKKWAYFFYLIDLNKDGVLKQSDFLSIVDRLEANEQAAISVPQSRWLRLQAKKLFDTLVFECNGRGNDQISLGQWLNLLKQHRRTGNSKFIRIFCLGCVRYIFNLFDLNGDGYIDFEEFQEIYRIYGISEGQIFLAFNRLDENEDGKLSRKEIDAGLEVFFTKESPDNFNYIFGEFHQPTPAYYRLALVG